MTVLRRGLLAVVAAVVLILVAVVLWGRSRDDAATPAKPSAPAASTGSGTVDALAQRYLHQAGAAPLGSASAKIPTTGGDTPSTVDILSLQAGATSTVLVWRWSTAAENQSPTSPLTTKLSGSHPGGDTEGVALVSEQSNQKLLPAGYLEAGGWSCTCSELPTNLGPDGAVLTGVYAPLGTAATQVKVEIPGFPAITVPVTRG